MAGDWIKMRIDLQTHPKIVRILSAMRPKDVQTKTDKFRVIGGLHAVWSVFDTHSTDGRLPGYSPETLDHIIGWEGFSDAMISVDWLVHTDGECLILPEFDEHNGKSGKRRAEDQKRKREERKSPQSVRNLSADEPDKLRTREEKRREELIKPMSSDDDVKSCPATSIVNLYHECLPLNPQVKVLNEARSKMIKRRWLEASVMDCKPFGYATREQGLAAWRKFFMVCADSEFLTGRAPTAPGKVPFVADIDFIFSPSGFAKILENKYHRAAV